MVAELPISTLIRWVHALPQCIHICNLLETFTLVHSGTSEQHKDCRQASQKGDKSDIVTFVEWLQAHPPFDRHDPDILCSIASGIVADESVNCDNALELGKSSMEKMIGKHYFDATLRQKEKVKAIAAMKNIIK